MVFYEKIHLFQTYMFNIIIITTYLLYVAIVLGVFTQAPQYLSTLQYYTKLYVSLFLIYRFNPFRKVLFTHLDSQIAFTAGMFLITTTFF